MEINCERCKDEVTGDSSVLVWWLTGTGTGKLKINPDKDEISFANLPKQVKVTVEVRAEDYVNSQNYKWSFDPDQEKYIPDLARETEFNAIAIRLTVAPPAEGLKQNVTLNSIIDGKQQQPKELAIDLAPNLPEITGLRVVPSIVGINGVFRLQWSIKNAVSWDLFQEPKGGSDGTLRKGCQIKPDARTLEVRGPRNDPHEPNPKEPGTYVYEIVAHGQGEAQSRARARLQVVDKAEWRDANQPWRGSELDDLMGKLVGLCVGIDKASGTETLYAVVLSEPTDTAPRGTQPTRTLWSSEDGFSGWTCLSTKVPPEVLTSPVVAMPSTDSTRPKPVLVFAGGSKIDFDPANPSNFSNQVYLLDLNDLGLKKKGEKEEAKWRKYIARWDPRAGHVCLLAPDRDKVRKFWVIGGLGEDGEALKDAWVSSNPGSPGTWEQRVFSGWPACYHFAAAVRENGTRYESAGGPEFWLLGGFQGRLNGDPYGKLHIFSGSFPGNTLVGKEPDLIPRPLIPEDKWRTSGVTLVVLNNQVYLIGTQSKGEDVGGGTRESKTLFTALEARDGSGAIVPALDRPVSLRFDDDPPFHRRIEAVSFNGCIWTFSLHLKAGVHGQVKASEFHYWVPPVQ